MRFITTLIAAFLLLPQLLFAQGGLTGVIPTDPGVNRIDWSYVGYGSSISGGGSSSFLIDGLRNGIGT